ncbi:putative F-box/LRR-repeat protein 23 [Salvia hispanica]|uniref:putative F-box/LRR-repeat protein 23 n=1 Tax=Salvia hispanica TaxID=49212 RepID=UPI00200943A1|nr:putative F-box/LRR-repeat protein 23 [Salvia hispanica]
MILTEPPIPTAAPAPPWIELPDDLTANILQRLGAEETLESAQKVCTTWWRVCKNPITWRVIDLDYRRCAASKFDKICLCAVDRSQGQLVELKLFCYEADDFLNYVAERSNQLRCLTLTEKDVLGTAYAKAIMKLPQLEELHFIKMDTVGPTDFENIGISCPTLKSLTFSNSWNEHLEFTEHAVAIGKTMSNLCHLRLIGQRMENKGLEAILDGCPRLESLELQRCSGLDLEGELGKRCSDQIKDLRLHFEDSASMGYLGWIMKQIQPQLTELKGIIFG